LESHLYCSQLSLNNTTSINDIVCYQQTIKLTQQTTFRFRSSGEARISFWEGCYFQYYFYIIVIHMTNMLFYSQAVLWW
jgi:hypothetical protein